MYLPQFSCSRHQGKKHLGKEFLQCEQIKTTVVRRDEETSFLGSSILINYSTISMRDKGSILRRQLPNSNTFQDTLKINCLPRQLYKNNCATVLHWHEKHCITEKVKEKVSAKLELKGWIWYRSSGTVKQSCKKQEVSPVYKDTLEKQKAFFWNVPDSTHF